MGRRLPPENSAGTDYPNEDLPDRKTAYRDVTRVALPAVAEMAFMSLIGAVDTMMVGRTLGAEALSAVGLSHQPRLLLLCLFFALNTGVTAVVARQKGEEKREEANAAFRTALLLALLLSLALAISAFLFAEPLLRLAGGDRAESGVVFSDAAAYFRVMACALPVHALSMCLCAGQRACGNTRVTFWINGIGNGINAVLNACLIGGRWGFPRLEVKGAAVASAAGMGASFLLALWTVTGKRAGYLRLSPGDSWRLDRASLRSLVRVSGSAALEQAGTRFGYFLCARTLFSLGDVSFAANQICMHLSALTFTVGDGLGVAGTALVGQALGKRRADLALLHGKICKRYAVMGSLVIGAVMAVFRRDIAGWFIGTQTENAGPVAACAAGTMLSLALIQPFQTGAVTLAGCLRGAGENRFVAAASVLCVGAARPILTRIAVKWLHTQLPGAWIIGSSELILRFGLFCCRFAHGVWRKETIRSTDLTKTNP